MMDECTWYANVLANLRRQIIAILRELPPELLNRRPLQSEAHETNSIAVLASHAAGAEYEWIAQVVGGRPQTRQRPDEFITVVANAELLIEKIERTAGASAEVLAALTAADLAQEHERGGNRYNARWCILHAIEHTALHLGHIEITRQLLTAS